MVTWDTADIQRDDAMLDMIGKGTEVRSAGELARLLCDWRREIVTPPDTGAPISQHTALLCIQRGHLSRHITPGRRIYRWLRDHGAATCTRLRNSSRRT